MKLDFSGRVALVTGASRGIGLQIARDLQSCGAELLLTSTVADDPRFGEAGLGPCRRFAVDFSDRNSRQEFMARVAALERLDVLVNNAGLTRHRSTEAVAEEDWDLTHDVDLKAPFFVTQAAAGVMRRAGYGRIVNIGSIWGHITLANRATYTAAKHGVRGMTLTHAVEFGPDNVLVNTVSPGFTLTDMVKRNYTAEQLEVLADRVPAGRLGTPDDVSRAVLFLASDLNTYITGQSLVVDGGYSIT